MSYFNDSMTSVEARNLFSELKNKTLNDEIRLSEFQKIVSEYSDVSDKIFSREMKAFDEELRRSTYIHTEEEEDDYRNGDIEYAE